MKRQFVYVEKIFWAQLIVVLFI